MLLGGKRGPLPKDKEVCQPDRNGVAEKLVIKLATTLIQANATARAVHAEMT